MGLSFPAAERPARFQLSIEGRSFQDSQRCVVPASAFFEFTGSKYPKSKWRFDLEENPVLGIAGLWRNGKSGERCFTMLTTAPGSDVAPYHDRQLVILRPEEWGRWLYLDQPEATLLKPLTEGSLTVSLARAGVEHPDIGEVRTAIRAGGSG